ncbi:MAG: GNAT family N-acetyltransferase [Nocardioidaceae bacterium]|nr:GNAT family N-acetyltransferase [Nocardioidaceae bacterium]
MSHALEFLDDPAKFQAVAAPLLEASPVVSTVVASVTARLRRDGVPAEPPAPLWWLVVRDDAGDVVGAGMRTSPEAPYAPYLLPMPDEAARELARTLHERGETVTRFNGALPATQVAGSETAALTGGTTRLAERMRLYELGTLTMQATPPGALRLAVAADLDVVLAYFDAFPGDADEQAGHTGQHSAPIESRESALRRIEAGEVWLWEVDGVPVHVTAFNPPQFGVARVGPVFTPKEHRGHGYAAAAVAEVSRVLQQAGNRVCLFAEVDNPVSCALYERLGYQTVVDMGNVVVG